MKDELTDNEHIEMLNNPEAELLGRISAFEKYVELDFEADKSLSMAGLTENDIAQIKIFCNIEHITIDEGIFKIGEEVEIISWYLKGLQGRLIQTSTGQKIRINILSLGCFATINIEKKDVKRISEVV